MEDDTSRQLTPHGADELARLQALIDAARTRLAATESDCTNIQRRLQAQRAAIFERLAPASKERDRLRLRIRFLTDFLDGLREEDEEAEAAAAENFREAWSQTQQEYTRAQAEFAQSKPPSKSDDEEVSALWRKLVKLYHPDKLGTSDDLRETYHKLISAINHARDTGNVAILREIAADAAGFVVRKGWGSLESAEQQQLGDLQRLLKSLQAEIVKVSDLLARLKRSPDYELAQLIERQPDVFEQVVARQLAEIDKESLTLREQAAALGSEIEKITGETPPEE